MADSRGGKMEYGGTLFEAVRRSARAVPRGAAYRFMGKQTSYADLLTRIDRFAKGLLALGIGPGDRVTICMPNVPQAVDCFYALNRIGAVSVLIHPLSAPDEIAYYLQTTKSKAILTLDRFYEKVRSAARVPVLVASIREELPVLPRLLYPLTKDGRKDKKPPKGSCIFWKSLPLLGKNISLPEVSGSAEDTACILFSGGTTGGPKGICLSNRNFNALAAQTVAASGYADVTGMKMLSILPIFHGFGLGVGIHTPLAGRACCVLVPRFSLREYTKLLKRERPDFIPGVPTLFEALLKAPGLEKTDLSFLRGIFCGGDSLSADLKRRMDAFLKTHGCAEQIREGYGLTECLGVACLTPREDNRPGYIGLPFRDTQFKIVTPGTTQDVPAGQSGEICICGPTVMTGYLDDGDATQKALRRHSDGRLWLHTGDLGSMDEDGFVRFLQRIKRLIVTSGYNVYPSRIENILMDHPKVTAACVIGVPDPYRGHRVRAYIVPAVPGSQALEAELLAYCEQKIARYAMPRELIFREELPMTPLGKVAYRILEEEANP